MELLDSFCVTGTDYEEFKEEVKEITDATKFVSANGAEVTVLSYCDLPKYQTPGRHMFYAFMPEIVEDILKGGKLKMGFIPVDPENPVKEGIMQEMKKSTGIILVIDKEKYILGRHALVGLCTNAATIGSATISRNNMLRDAHVADCLHNRRHKIGIVYREDNGVKKAFAVTGSKYTMVPQTVVIDIADKMIEEKILGKVNVFRWSIDHNFTNLILTFPEAAEDFEATYGVKGIIPGVIICTSDTGDSSVIIKGIFLKGNSYVITEEVRKIHTLTIDASKVLSEVDDRIFANVRKLPETLMKLIGKSITDYSRIDLSTSRGCSRNIDILQEFLKSKIMPEFANTLTKKASGELLNNIIAELNPTIPYTLYDIAEIFMTVPERIEGINANTLNNVRKVCAKIPYVLAKYAKSDTHTDVSKEEEIILI